MKIVYEIHELTSYINWAYFYFAWQLKDERQQSQIRMEADAFLKSLDGKYKVYALFQIMDAYSESDDIVLLQSGVRLPMLRQQQVGSEYLSLADFVSDKPTKIGIFATSVDRGMETDFDDEPYQKMMAQLLADRLAEAAAERMHEEVRKNYWGYATDENLSIKEMQMERFVGIRPAVGYPSLPDVSLNFLINDVIDMKQIGISLTESGAMRPHASVSGLMLSHPKSHYFSIGKIGDDQVADYARRRQLPVEIVRKFLSANI
jgi:cobalamin-dependent methionine synthase I